MNTGKTQGKLPSISKIPLQGNGMATMPKKPRTLKNAKIFNFRKTLDDILQQNEKLRQRLSKYENIVELSSKSSTK